MFEISQEPTTVEFPVVSRGNESMLERFAPIKQQDYRDFKSDFLSWLSTKGKRPFRGDGYSDSTVRSTHYKIEVAYRWLWDERESYTKEFGPEDASAFIDTLLAKSPKRDPEIYDFVKALKRLFKWFNDARGGDLEWNYERSRETIGLPIRDTWLYYIRKEIEEARLEDD